MVAGRGRWSFGQGTQIDLWHRQEKHIWHDMLTPLLAGWWRIFTTILFMHRRSIISEKKTLNEWQHANECLESGPMCKCRGSILPFCRACNWVFWARHPDYVACTLSLASSTDSEREVDCALEEDTSSPPKALRLTLSPLLLCLDFFNIWLLNWQTSAVQSAHCLSMLSTLFCGRREVMRLRVKQRWQQRFRECKALL